MSYSMTESSRKIVIRKFARRHYTFFISRIREIIKSCGNHAIKKSLSPVKLKKESKHNGLTNCDILLDNMYVFFD